MIQEISIVQVIHPGAIGEANGGSKDAFVMKLNSSGDLQWVTQLGGTTTASGGRQLWR